MLLRIIAVSFFLSSILLSQLPENIQRYRADNQGDVKNRRQGVLDGNRVRTIYYNTGEVAQWPYAPSGEWPKGSGHQYLDGVTVLIAAEVTAPGNGQTVHLLEAEYREEMPKDPVTGQIWGLEPVPGYDNPDRRVNGIVSAIPAMNRDTASFPPSWPAALGVDSRWNGYWYGYFGRGVNNADFETFFVMDDSKDQKFMRPPYLYFPIAADSERGGLGLRVETRTFQWQNQFLQDVIFLKYDVWNISDYDYDSTAFGFFIDPGVGGVGSGNDDAGIDSQHNLAYAWDHNQKGDPAFGDWKPGYFGIGIVGSPGNPNPAGITSFGEYLLADQSPNGVWPKNNEVIWKKMTSGFVDTGVVNSNISIVVGSGTFGLKKWSKEQYVAVLVLGDDFHDIVSKKVAAQKVCDNNFIIPDSLLLVLRNKEVLLSGFELDQNFPNPFNPVTHFRFILAEARSVTVKVFDMLGREVATLVNEKLRPGSYSVEWDATNFPSGAYCYQLKAGNYVETKKMVLLR